MNLPDPKRALGGAPETSAAPPCARCTNPSEWAIEGHRVCSGCFTAWERAIDEWRGVPRRIGPALEQWEARCEVDWDAMPEDVQEAFFGPKPEKVQAFSRAWLAREKARKSA